MTSRVISRRTVLGATAAMTAATAAGGTPLLGLAMASPADPTDPRMRAESAGLLQRLEVVSVPSIGEEVRFYAAASLNPNGTSAGTTLHFAGTRGVRPVNSVPGTNYASVSLDVPLGSMLTSIEYVIEGTPQAGRVSLIKWTADSATAFSYLYNQTIPAAVNGINVYSQALAEVVDGLHTYEAFYSDNGVAIATSVCNGIRLRYVPPSSGFVAITPARAYDSRLNMIPDANGTLAGGANRTVSVVNARDISTGAVTGALVPEKATAVAYTLTVTDTTGQGFLAVNPGGIVAVSASSINWFGAGEILANTGVVKLGPGRALTVVAGGGSTHFIIDIVGYYM
jgi:hypothetical protein